MKPSLPPSLTPLPPLRFPLSKRLRQLRPWRTKIRLRYCLLPQLLSLLAFSGFVALFPQHIMNYWLALIAVLLLYLSYRQLLMFRLAKARPKFKRIKQQMVQHLLHYKAQVNHFNQQRAQYLEQCQELHILAYQLRQLPAFALKQMRQQQQEAFFSQYPLTASPVALVPLLLKRLRSKGISNAADIAKLTPKLIWNPLSCAQYTALLKWRRYLLQKFTFSHQPLQLAKLQKQMRSHIQQQQAQLSFKADQSLQHLWLQHQQVLEQRKTCLAQLLVLRKALKKQANLVGIATLIK